MFAQSNLISYHTEAFVKTEVGCTVFHDNCYLIQIIFSLFLGNCCWQLYNDVFFTGKVKQICGESNQLVSKNHNIGSIKLIGPLQSMDAENI